MSCQRRGEDEFALWRWGPQRAMLRLAVPQRWALHPRWLSHAVSGVEFSTSRLWVPTSEYHVYWVFFNKLLYIECFFYQGKSSHWRMHVSIFVAFSSWTWFSLFPICIFSCKREMRIFFTCSSSFLCYVQADTNFSLLL